jgi:hypothetical protein
MCKNEQPGKIGNSINMTNPTTKTSLSRFALIAGIGMLFMRTTPFAEFFVYHRLVVPENAAETAKNILSHKSLFISGIFCYLINFIADLVVAWAELSCAGTSKYPPWIPILPLHFSGMLIPDSGIGAGIKRGCHPR